MKNHGWIKAKASAALCACLLVTSTLVLLSWFDNGTAGSQDDEGAKKAFTEAYPVFSHPRCLNCHPSGDEPLIRDESKPHMFGVKRGPDGKGAGMMSCTLCHQERNRPDGPPGVPNWHMPPESMPMAFQGRTPGELCRQLKDPGQNGGRTGDQVTNHIVKDPLVQWGWNPGKGRTTPKMSHSEFSSKLQEWVKKGCACPD
ncbi:hypothetical protein EG829_30645 [bacterium]|nr:hypothetical protein [bacterium]